MVIQFTDFLPYYDELKIGGHMAVALAAAFAGGLGIWLATLFSPTSKIGFCESFTVSLFCASAIWIIPSGLPIPPLYVKIGIAFFLSAPFFINFFAFGLEWKKSAVLWLAFCLSQLLVFSIIYYYVIQ